MRWEQLFADLDSRFSELADADMMAELGDRQRVMTGTVSMAQRCAGALECALRLRTRSGAMITGTLRRVGPDWLLLGLEGQSEVVVALAAVTMIEGLTTATGVPLSTVTRKFDMRLALRGLARDRAAVVVTVVGTVSGMTGEAYGAGAELSGTIDRIGQDYVELAQHPIWEARRASRVRSVALVPLSSIDSVRSQPMG